MEMCPYSSVTHLSFDLPTSRDLTQLLNETVSQDFSPPVFLSNCSFRSQYFNFLKIFVHLFNNFSAFMV